VCVCVFLFVFVCLIGLLGTVVLCEENEMCVMIDISFGEVSPPDLS